MTTATYTLADSVTAILNELVDLDNEHTEKTVLLEIEILRKTLRFLLR